MRNIYRIAPVSYTHLDSLINKPLRTDSLYGPAITQAAMSRVDLLHDAGFKGQGKMCIRDRL